MNKLSQQNIVDLFKKGAFSQVIVGNISKFEEKSGQYGTFYNFSVGTQIGSGQEKETVWFDCIANENYQFEKGDKVIVFGKYSAYESQNGKVYHKIATNFAQVLSKSKNSQQQQQQQQEEEIKSNEDDDIPF